MVRQYVQVTDTQRLELVHLIHQEGHSIAKAAKITNIPYDNAKAINRTYLREKRINKINYRLRYQKKSLSSNSSRKVSIELDSAREDSHDNSATNCSSEQNSASKSVSLNSHYLNTKSSEGSSFENFQLYSQMAQQRIAMMLSQNQSAFMPLNTQNNK